MWNTYIYRYESLEKAASNPDGLAVLATFFQIQRGDNSQWSKLVSGLQSVKTASKRGYEVTELSLRHFIPASGSEFYRYSGSLTTPNCYESVTWTIFRQPLAISEGQMSFFRSLTNGLHQPIINNFRPLQPLNGRWIIEKTVLFWPKLFEFSRAFINSDVRQNIANFCRRNLSKKALKIIEKTVKNSWRNSWQID